MNIASVLRYGYTSLKALEQPRLEAELLLCHLLQVPRTFLIAHSDQAVSLDLFEQFKTLCQRRIEREPLAYLLGTKEFWSLEFEVNSNTLIPRPETETLVETALNLLPANNKLMLADLGVGSGAVAIALAIERPNWQILASDISLTTLEVASRNVARHSLSNVNLVQSNWCEALPFNTFDAIISNPPYIAENDPHLKQLQWEPRTALVSGTDGLNAIRLIISQAGAHLKQDGLLLLEHGYNQAKTVHNLMQMAGFIDIQSFADTNGILRVTSGWWHLHENSISK